LLQRQPGWLLAGDNCPLDIRRKERQWRNPAEIRIGKSPRTFCTSNVTAASANFVIGVMAEQS